MGGMTTDIKLLDENGRRVDGRTPEEMRPLRIEAGVLKRADGSAYVEWGLNKVLAAVYGPRECHPRHMQNPTRALVQCKYNMAAFSVDDRKRPGPDRRSQEISKITSEALTHVVFTEYFPRASIDVYIEVLQANAGTRCAGLTAASVALADAGVPMRDLVASCAAGKAAGTVMVDLGKEEDNFGEADIPVGYVPRTKEIVLLQMDGDLTQDEYVKGLNMAIHGCEKVYEIQRDALKRRYEARALDTDIAAPEGAGKGVA
ncbi:MAG: exosome complex component [Candidatus Thermoplasmatota archaeon]|nr:exosome complex component [Candidatus Thermoplasmatota archaeon]